MKATREKNIDLIRLIYKRLNEISISIFSSSTKEPPRNTRESNMQGCLEFPSLVDPTTYLMNLMKPKCHKFRDHTI